MTITQPPPFPSWLDRTSHLSYLGRLIVGMKYALEKLGVSDVANSDLEAFAVFIHESMSISSRNYHSVKHVFDLAEGWDNPIGILAAFFHDCIYHHVDGGLSPMQQKLLSDVCEDRDHKTFLLPHSDNDVLRTMVEGLFGFTSGQELLPLKGLNEFLSAIVAVRMLEKLLNLQDLTKIAVCIEATIPFRPHNQEGKSPLEMLFERLMVVNTDCAIGLSKPDCIHAVQIAAELSNRDVGNFGSEDRAYFLDNTWSLLPESNEALRASYLYTVQEFQFAIFKMNGFFHFLDPAVIFGTFRGMPLPEHVEALTMQARRNMEVGRKYVGAKLLALSVLSAFAELTGGDAPMSLFMGDLPSRHHESYRLEDDLPEPTAVDSCDREVYDILSKGRKSETAFDIRQSPLAAYLYGCMGDDVEKYLSAVKVYPMDKDKALTFLRMLPQDVIRLVSDSMTRIAVSRADLIEDAFGMLDDVGGDSEE